MCVGVDCCSWWMLAISTPEVPGMNIATVQDCYLQNYSTRFNILVIYMMTQIT